MIYLFRGESTYWKTRANNIGRLFGDTKIGTISLLDNFVVFSKYSLFFLILNRFDGKKCMLYVENFSMRGRSGKDGGRFLRGNGV